MKAIILAAGYATRLYPLTKEFPKPLLELNKRPIIDYILEDLEEISRIKQIIVVTNSKFISHFRRWAKARRFKKPLKLVDDQTKDLKDRLGAIGDMEFAISSERINDDILVIGGDNFFDSRLKGFVSFCGNNPVIGAYDVKSREKARHYGVIKLNRRRRVVDFQEKPANPKSTRIAMCLYYFPKRRLGLVKEYLGARHKRDATGLYIDWLRKRVPVYGFVFGGRWYDIGDHRFYNEAKKGLSE
ncbi:MAG: nucleotidyltransferase family protein [Candidatus Omnitrophica bacterium]|nr:nucleotidyltransferase family protein [Candidatus Omnitrophota bacterium]